MIISNNLIGKMPIPDDAIIRVNLAWIKNVNEARKILDSKHDIYLDYPRGRTKPPKPVITLEEAIELSRFPSVKYFAVSNAEKISDLQKIIYKLDDVEFVPKIETTIGVYNLDKMIDMGIKTIMLDKEDLYTDVDCDSERFELLLKRVREYKDLIKILELQGVVFI